MDQFEGKQTYSGTFGECWIDDLYIGELEAFKLEVNISYSDVIKVGTLVADKKIQKVEVKGSVKMHKCRDTLEKRVLADLKAGKTPVMTVVGKLDDPDVNGQTRVSCKKCYFDKATLLDIESQKNSESSYNFDAGDMPEFLDSVD